MKKKKNRMVFPGLLLAVPAALMLVVTGCPQPDQTGLWSGKNGEKKEEIRLPGAAFAPAAFLFKLEGETDVTNVKLMWAKQDDCVLYEVYRDGALAGKVLGARFDDYGLNPGQTYSYTVKAYTGIVYTGTTVPGSILNEASLKLKSVSSAVSTTPFIPDGPVISTVYNSTISTPDFINVPSTEPAGYLMPDGKRYQYSIGTTVREQVSTDNGATWSTARTIGTVTGSKLEGQGQQRIGDKIVFTAHHERSADYVWSNFFMATINPGAADATTWSAAPQGDGSTGTLEIVGAMPADPAFVVTFCERPLGIPSRDMNVYTDEHTGTGYLLSATDGDTNIFELDAAWTTVVGDKPVNSTLKGEWRETPFIMYRDGYYFLFTSLQNGWYPSQSQYAYAASLDGEWSKSINVGPAASGGSQFNHVRKYSNNTYTLTAYRWATSYDRHKENRTSNKNLPLAFNGSYAAAAWFDKVDYYTTHGIVGVQPGRILTQGLGVRISPSSASADADKAYANAFAVIDGEDSDSSNRQVPDYSGQFRGNALPYSLDIDLGAPAVLTGINLATRLVKGSDSAFMFNIEASVDGANYTQVLNSVGSGNSTITAAPSGWELGFKFGTITDTTAYRYVRFNLTGVMNVRSSDGAAGWADGIIELTIFGNP
ncbi:hypothetical protein AGMMS49991_09720 [Spirochaetia bacterium]|nr:hypothetical protein AGMMS49991_09720 [Spirochaetia bacterium]